MIVRYFSLLFVWLISASPAASHAEAGPIRQAYAAEEVGQGVYVVHGPNGLPNPVNQGFMNNPGFILTSDGVVVIDPGSSVYVGRMLLRMIAKITDQPIIATISTHIHGDHWLGNQAITERFPEAALYGHPDLISRAHNGEAQNWLDLMMRLTSGATAGTVAVIPDVPLDHGAILQFGEFSVSVHHHGHAHTNSDIALMVTPGNILFTGDLVFNRRVGRIDDGSFTGLTDTLKKLLSLQASTVVPGHGMTESSDQSIRDTIKLYETLYTVVQEKFEEGMADYEMKPFVVDALGAFSDWTGFEDSIGRLISLAYLEVEENNF